MERWEQVEDVVQGQAELDLMAGAAMARPCFVAFAGDELCFVAFLREFEKGAYHDAVIELLALAGPLGADRLAFAVTARAWSLDDPIPPVADGVDLRQRVLVVELVDAVVGHRSILRPFDEPAPGKAVRWGERQELEGSEGWLASALTFAASAEGRERLAAPDDAIAAQAIRCEQLGHLLIWSPAVGARLASHRQARGRPHPARHRARMPRR